MFWTSLTQIKFSHGGRIFDMDSKNEVLLQSAKSCRSGIASIIESAPFRERYTKSHVISSTEARERTIFRFSWCTHGHGDEKSLLFRGRGLDVSGVAEPSPRVIWRGNMVDGLPRPASM